MKSKNIHVRCETCDEDHIDTKHTWHRKHSGHLKVKCQCNDSVCVARRAKSPLSKSEKNKRFYENLLIVHQKLGTNFVCTIFEL